MPETRLPRELLFGHALDIFNELAVGFILLLQYIGGVEYGASLPRVYLPLVHRNGFHGLQHQEATDDINCPA
jgi:hypothetical protein